jgi:mono/diheme cytochrome c family protein
MKPLLVVLAALAGAACSTTSEWDPDELASGKTERERATLEKGRDSYALYCAGCHGDGGGGDGPAARFLEPKPRDLRKARIKFAAVPAGSIPRDEDLDRALVHGLQGTAMPAWPLLPQDERAAIIAYIKTLSDAWTKRAPGGSISLGQDPYRRNPARAVELGATLYHQRQCWTCHPAYVDAPRLAELTGQPEAGRADLHRSVLTDSDWGAKILPPDFRVDRVKSASTIPELARVIAHGVGGTAMPSWGTSLPPEEIWAIAYYVDSLLAAQQGGAR